MRMLSGQAVQSNKSRRMRAYNLHYGFASARETWRAPFGVIGCPVFLHAAQSVSGILVSAWMGAMLAMTRFQATFGALVLAQAAHSVEEYFGRLWEPFPPTRFLTGLISQDLERGFLIINASLLVFGLWCLFWPLRRGWRSAFPLAWAWVAMEVINGIGHPLWTLRQGGYTPGVITAPLLLALAVYLALQLRRIARGSSIGDSPCQLKP